MSVTAKCLANSQFAPIADTTIYFAPVSTKTIIDKFTATNTDGSTRTLSVNIIPNGGSVGGDNLIVSTISITAGSTADLTELQNQILNEGDAISVVASLVNAIVVRVSGREIA
jgi:hypothetical protein